VEGREGRGGEEKREWKVCFIGFWGRTSLDRVMVKLSSNLQLARSRLWISGITETIAKVRGYLERIFFI